MDFPKMQSNRAYGYLPPQPAPASTLHKKEVLPPTTVPDSSYYVIEKALFDDPEPHTEEADCRDESKLRSSSQESDPGYDYIKDTVPELEPEPLSIYSTTPTKNTGAVAITTNKLSSVERFRKEGYTH